MHIVCPDCGKDHEVADEKLPAQKFNAICRGCAARFIVVVGSCLVCGAKNQEGQPCPCLAENKQEFLEIIEIIEDSAGSFPDEEEVAEAKEEFIAVSEVIEELADTFPDEEEIAEEQEEFLAVGEGNEDPAVPFPEEEEVVEDKEEFLAVGEKIAEPIVASPDNAEVAVVGEEMPEPTLRPELYQVREEYLLQFTGTGWQYFRIWIVNLFLTIITLGIYAAWAKVRTRQYFYSHTSCAAEPFDYLANPLIILRSNVIVGAGFVCYMLIEAFTPLVSSLVVVAVVLLFPLLVFKSLNFYAHNSAYRNIRFHFLGTIKESYKIYLLLPFLVIGTLGLLYPYWAYRRKKYFFENIAFGNRRNAFTAIPIDFYKVYIKALVLIVVPVAVAFVLLVFIGGMIMGMSISSLANMSGGFAAFFIIVYLGVFLATIFAQQYVYAKITNYCWRYSSMGSVKFRSSLGAGKLMWIRMTNIMALILSAGLLFPWTKVRQSRYVLENLTIITYQGLDHFVAGEQYADGALGDAAMDFFDFEVGL